MARRERYATMRARLEKTSVEKPMRKLRGMPDDVGVVAPSLALQPVSVLAISKDGKTMTVTQDGRTRFYEKKFDIKPLGK